MPSPRPEPEPTPEELALRARRGSLPAFSALVTRFEPRLFNFLLRRVPADVAEDLTQETFLRAWQRIHQYNPKWKFSTWLFTIGSRIAASHYRKPAPPRVGVAFDAPSKDGEHPLHRLESRTRVWRIVEASLSPDQHAAVWLRYAEDCSIRDIAAIMGRTQVGVRVMLFRARAILAEALGDEVEGDAVGTGCHCSPALRRSSAESHDHAGVKVTRAPSTTKPLSGGVRC